MKELEIEEAEGGYTRIKETFVPLRSGRIRNVNLSIGQLREGGQISRSMIFLVERNDYPPGAQFLCLRLSTVRMLWVWIASVDWGMARRLRPAEIKTLDANARSP